MKQYYLPILYYPFIYTTHSVHFYLRLYRHGHNGHDKMTQWLTDWDLSRPDRGAVRGGGGGGGRVEELLSCPVLALAINKGGDSQHLCHKQRS